MWVEASSVLVQDNDVLLHKVSHKMASTGVEAAAALCPEWEGKRWRFDYELDALANCLYSYTAWKRNDVNSWSDILEESMRSVRVLCLRTMLVLDNGRDLVCVCVLSRVIRRAWPPIGLAVQCGCRIRWAENVTPATFMAPLVWTGFRIRRLLPLSSLYRHTHAQTTHRPFPVCHGLVAADRSDRPAILNLSHFVRDAKRRRFVTFNFQAWWLEVWPARPFCMSWDRRSVWVRRRIWHVVTRWCLTALCVGPHQGRSMTWSPIWWTESGKQGFIQNIC